MQQPNHKELWNFYSELANIYACKAKLGFKDLTGNLDLDWVVSETIRKGQIDHTLALDSKINTKLTQFYTPDGFTLPLEKLDQFFNYISQVSQYLQENDNQFLAGWMMRTIDKYFPPNDFLIKELNKIILNEDSINKQNYLRPDMTIVTATRLCDAYNGVYNMLQGDFPKQLDMIQSTQLTIMLAKEVLNTEPVDYINIPFN